MAKNFFSQYPTFYKYDRFWIGLLIGLLVPLLGIFIVFGYGWGRHVLFQADMVPLSTLLQSARSLPRLSSFMSVGCILNLGVFYYFLNKDYFNVGKGVIMATIIISIPVVINVIRTGLV